MNGLNFSTQKRVVQHNYSNKKKKANSVNEQQNNSILNDTDNFMLDATVPDFESPTPINEFSNLFGFNTPNQSRKHDFLTPGFKNMPINCVDESGCGGIRSVLDFTYKDKGNGSSKNIESFDSPGFNKDVIINEKSNKSNSRGFDFFNNYNGKNTNITNNELSVIEIGDFDTGIGSNIGINSNSIGDQDKSSYIFTPLGNKNRKEFQEKMVNQTVTLDEEEEHAPLQKEFDYLEDDYTEEFVSKLIREENQLLLTQQQEAYSSLKDGHFVISKENSSKRKLKENSSNLSIKKETVSFNNSYMNSTITIDSTGSDSQASMINSFTATPSSTNPVITIASTSGESQHNHRLNVKADKQTSYTHTPLSSTSSQSSDDLHNYSVAEEVSPGQPPFCHVLSPKKSRLHTLSKNWNFEEQAHKSPTLLHQETSTQQQSPNVQQQPSPSPQTPQRSTQLQKPQHQTPKTQLQQHTNELPISQTHQTPQSKRTKIDDVELKTPINDKHLQPQQPLQSEKVKSDDSKDENKSENGYVLMTKSDDHEVEVDDDSLRAVNLTPNNPGLFYRQGVATDYHKKPRLVLRDFNNNNNNIMNTSLRNSYSDKTNKTVSFLAQTEHRAKSKMHKQAFINQYLNQKHSVRNKLDIDLDNDNLSNLSPQKKVRNNIEYKRINLETKLFESLEQNVAEVDALLNSEKRHGTDSYEKENEIHHASLLSNQSRLQKEKQQNEAQATSHTPLQSQPRPHAGPRPSTSQPQPSQQPRQPQQPQQAQPSQETPSSPQTPPPQGAEKIKEKQHKRSKSKRSKLNSSQYNGYDELSKIHETLNSKSNKDLTLTKNGKTTESSSSSCTSFLVSTICGGALLLLAICANSDYFEPPYPKPT